MEQLMMYRKSAPVPQYKIPNGFTVRKFDKNKYKDDVDAWLDICKEGILGPCDNEDTFREFCVDYPDADPSDIIFLEYGNEPAATVFAIEHKGKRGYVHMVCCKEKYRKMGVGKALNGLVLSELENKGCTESYLTTDDFRIAAIKGYIDYGFIPVIYQDDMTKRWKDVLNILKIINIKTVKLIDDKFTDNGYLL